MKIFIDTNIFLDLLLKREFFQEAMVIFNAVDKKIFDAIILDITILNIDYIAKKQLQDIRDFLNTINITFEVFGASNSMIAEALKIDNNDLEDNLQYTSAKKTKCDLIITNDKNFYSEDIDKYTSKEFCKRFIKE